jgi:antitoxin component YwqK of YwqJK toxin-antitoxin module
MFSSKHITPLLNVWYFIFCLSWVFASCNSSTSHAEAGAGDLAGYELTAIPGSSTQYAVRKDGAGQVVSEGYVNGNKKSGQWLEYSVDGDIALIENFVDGLREGWVMKMITRGQIDNKAKYHQGLLHGPWIQYKFGKVLEQRNYSMGKLDGVARTFDDRTWKVKQEVEYKNGVQDGFFRYYDENGTVTLEYIYKNGEKVSGGMTKPQ